MENDQKQDFVNAVKGKWQEPSWCPRCHAEDWRLRQLVLLPTIAENGAAGEIGGVPVLPISRGNYGFMQFIDGIVSGTYKGSVI